MGRRESEAKLTAADVRELLNYDPETGVLRWKAGGKGRKRKSNGVAGYFDNRLGYHRVRIGEHNYLGHRIGWLLSYNEWPAMDVDHINGNPSDNRLANLRRATNSQNQQNRRLGSNNTSGYKGVFFNKQCRKWAATIFADGRARHLGLFSTPDQAHVAYVDAAKKFFGEFARAA